MTPEELHALTIPDYPSRSFQHENGFRTVPWDDWAGMQRRAIEFKDALAKLQAQHETDRTAAVAEALERAAQICDEGVKWEPNFPPNTQRVTDETCHLLAKAIRSMKDGNG